MRVDTVKMPAFLACALINGDTSGLDESDMQWLKAAEEYVAPGRVVSTVEDCEGYFSWSCELPGYTLGAEMMDYVVLYPD